MGQLLAVRPKPSLSPFSLIFVQRRYNYPVMQHCLGGGRGVKGICLFSSLLFFFFFLSILHLLANLVAQDLVPIDLGARHRKLAA